MLEQKRQPGGEDKGYRWAFASLTGLQNHSKAELPVAKTGAPQCWALEKHLNNKVTTEYPTQS